MGRWSILVHCGLGLMISACDLEDASGSQPLHEAGAADDAAERLYEHNGFRLNGFRLNGFRLNGFRLNGPLFGDADDGESWIALEEIVLADQTAVAKGWLEGSDLHIETVDGEVLGGQQLVGAILEFGVADGQLGEKHLVRVRIKDAGPEQPGSDVWLYDLAILDGGSSWEPLCVDKDNKPVPAVLLGDVWDPETGDRVTPRPDGAVTFACLDAALGKCVEWGYAPWRSVDGVSLVDYHQACTRAVRADYCGDGTPHTVDGVTVHFTDDLEVQKADLDTPYAVEAEWGPGGAVCLNKEHTRLPDPELECEAPPPCGESFESGGLVQTGTPSA